MLNWRQIDFDFELRDVTMGSATAAMFLNYLIYGRYSTAVVDITKRQHSARTPQRIFWQPRSEMARKRRPLSRPHEKMLHLFAQSISWDQIRRQRDNHRL